MVRVLTFEGNEVIDEASELTKSPCDVLVGQAMAASDFTKHLLAYENRRQ